MHKKRIFMLCTLLVLTVAIAIMSLSAMATEVTSWYFHHSKNGEQPPTPAEFGYIDQFDGYYVDKNHPATAADKVLYLTFDAGYENGNVAKILDVLRAEQVPGAFFILEGLVEHEPALVQRMCDEGHLVCNHTASHRDMTTVHSLADFQAEMNRMEEVYTACTGQKLAPYYRPPEGKLNRESIGYAKDSGYSTILWSFAYGDWDNGKQMEPEKAKAKILGETHNGEVILLHPTSATNAAILSDLIHTWRDMGYRFGTLDELTGRMG